jgi:hypothetical protein
MAAGIGSSIGRIPLSPFFKFRRGEKVYKEKKVFLIRIRTDWLLLGFPDPD